MKIFRITIWQQMNSYHHEAVKVNYMNIIDTMFEERIPKQIWEASVIASGNKGERERKREVGRAREIV